MKIKELIDYGKKILNDNNVEDSNIIAKVLAKYILKLDSNQIIVNSEKEISEEERTRYYLALIKIMEGMPLQYITNKQEFMGLDFYVDENVLIPQPDTEVLVEEVLKICKNYTEEINILDICTGSGAIGISIAKNAENAKVLLSDISKNTVEIAKKNAWSNGVEDRLEFAKSDMFENINKKFDIIVSNPPYIETDVIKTLDSQVQNEPHLALDGGKDGLNFYKILAKEAKKYLKDDGYLCLEIGYDQKDKVEELLKNNGYKKIYTKKDLSGNDRVVIANKGE